MNLNHSRQKSKFDKKYLLHFTYLWLKPFSTTRLSLRGLNWSKSFKFILSIFGRDIPLEIFDLCDPFVRSSLIRWRRVCMMFSSSLVEINRLINKWKKEKMVWYTFKKVDWFVSENWIWFNRQTRNKNKFSRFLKLHSSVRICTNRIDFCFSSIRWSFFQRVISKCRVF